MGAAWFRTCWRAENPKGDPWWLGLPPFVDKNMGCIRIDKMSQPVGRIPKMWILLGVWGMLPRLFKNRYRKMHLLVCFRAVSGINFDNICLVILLIFSHLLKSKKMWFRIENERKHYRLIEVWLVSYWVFVMNKFWMLNTRLREIWRLRNGLTETPDKMPQIRDVPYYTGWVATLLMMDHTISR